MHIPFDIEPPASIELRTKNISCLYENGNLRFIRAGNEPLVDAIYSAVRDSNWGTVPYTITQENIQQNEQDFTISYTAQFRQNDILFETICRIEGRADDSLLFEMNGAAQSLFYSNRIGLCVHLPADECNGMPVRIVSDNGEEKQADFPVNISLHQPFFQIQQMQWKTASGNQIQLEFEGDVFEAEDQRNWMDNSYKIYSRPLHLPFPFMVEEGYTMQQKIWLQFSNESAIGVPTNKQIEENTFVPMPAIGFAAANKPALLSTNEIRLLNYVPFAHYRAELDFETDWKLVLHTHVTNAISLNISLELVLFFSDDYAIETEAFVQAITSFAGLIKSILPLHKKHKVTPVFLQPYFYPLMKQKFPDIQTGYGTDVYFAELNRQRPTDEQYDFLSFSINPQVHAFDTDTLLQNTGSIKYMLATIKSFTNKPVYISPVTFKKRRNHDSTSDNRHEPIDNSDERQHTWLGAGWFLLCLYALHDAAHATFFTTAGTNGILDETSPLFQMLHRLQLFSPAAMRKVEHNIIFKNEKEEEMVFSLDKLFFK